MKKLYASLFSLIVALSCFALAGRSDSYLRNRVVMVKGNGISCTGEQVRAPSGVDYILTAGHCNKAIVDGKIEVITESGARLMRSVIAEDPTSDLLLVEGLPNLRGLDVAATVMPFERVITLTHGGRKPTYKTEGVIVSGSENVKAVTSLGESVEDCKKRGAKYDSIVIEDIGLVACVLSVEETVTTATIVPGSSGGPVMNSSGELIGVASMCDGFFGYTVRLLDIRAFLAGY